MDPANSVRNRQRADSAFPNERRRQEARHARERESAFYGTRLALGGPRSLQTANAAAFSPHRPTAIRVGGFSLSPATTPPAFSTSGSPPQSPPTSCAKKRVTRRPRRDFVPPTSSLSPLQSFALFLGLPRSELHKLPVSPAQPGSSSAQPADITEVPAPTASGTHGTVPRNKRRSRRRHPKVTEQTPVVSDSDSFFHATSKSDRLGQYSAPESAVFQVRNTSEMNSEFEYDCVSRAHNVSKFTSAPIKHETEFIAPLETAVQADLKNSGTVDSVCVIPETVNSVSGNSGSVNPEPALPTLTPMFQSDYLSCAPPRSAAINTQTDNLTLEKQKTIVELHTHEQHRKVNSSEVPVPAEYKTVNGVSSLLDYAALQPVYLETVCVNAPVSATDPFVLDITDSDSAKPGSSCAMTVLETATPNMDSLRPTELPGVTRHESLFANTASSSTNSIFPVSVSVPVLRSPPLVPVTRAARAQPSLAPVPVPRERVAEVQLVPASVPSLAEAPFIPAPVPAPRVGLMDTQPLPAPVPVPRVRSAVTLPTPAPVSVPRVGATEVQLAPAPTPAPRVKAARAQLVPAPVSVSRVGMAGVRPGLAPVPVPRRRAAQSQTPVQPQAQLPLQLALLSITQSVAQLLTPILVLSPVQTVAQLAAPSPVQSSILLPAIPPSLQRTPLSLAQSVAQVIAQVSVLLPAQSLAQPLAPQAAQSSALLPLQSFASLPVSLSAQLLSLSPAQCLAQQPVQSLPTSAGSLCEPSSPAEDDAVLTHFKLTVCPTQLQPSHPKPAACPVPLQSAPAVPEDPAPAGSASVSAGGSGGPLQPLLVSAGGSGEPLQPLLVSAGGSGEPLQPLLVSAGGSGEPLQPLLVSAGGSGEPLQPLLVSAGGSGEPLQPLLVSAGGPEGPVQPPSASAPPGLAPASSETSSSSGPASASPAAAPACALPAAAPSSPGPAQSSPVAATPQSGPASSGPVPTGPRPTCLTPVCRRCLPHGRPPELLHRLLGRRLLPRGRPPDQLCHLCHPSGRPPDRVTHVLLCLWALGRPPDIYYGLVSCAPVFSVGGFVSCSGPSVLGPRRTG
ncbi:proline-rich protein 36-like [Haplochromis burtoni]|uniref:proline-rich protein 36-like n=1 Tax=Haplochromis burtoni TaxID=8153 RepID=UPI001C2DF0E4|nr:proline-rich protein 36-like [Haplochromis burtoni]